VPDELDILTLVRRSAAAKVLYLPHAIRQMSRPDRMIAGSEVRAVIAGGEVIEDYPEDPRGHSCPLLGHGELGRPIHVVCAPKQDYLAIITAYLPDEEIWEDDFRARRRT